MNRQKHKLTQILKYIVTGVDDNTDFKTFMTSNELSDISFLNSPKIFESINNLFFFFEEDEKKLKQKGTRKIVLHNTRNTRRKALKANQQKDL